MFWLCPFWTCSETYTVAKLMNGKSIFPCFFCSRLYEMVEYFFIQVVITPIIADHFMDPRTIERL